MKLSRPGFVHFLLPLLWWTLLGALPSRAVLQTVTATPATAPSPATPDRATVYIIPLPAAASEITASAPAFIAALDAVPAGAPMLLDLDSRLGNKIVEPDPTVHTGFAEKSASALLRALAARRHSGPVLAFVHESSGPATILLAAADAIYAPASAIIRGMTGARGGSGSQLPVSLAELENLAAPQPYRVEVMCSLFVEQYTFLIGNTTIRGFTNNRLGLTGESAARQYGDPPQPLLVTAVEGSLDDALLAYFKGQPFQTQTWSADGFTPRLVAAAPPAPASVAVTPSPTPSTSTASAPLPSLVASPPPALSPAKPRASVYVVPIEGEISTPQLYILRRALKSAIENHVDAIVLDMNTPGGRVDVTLDMMDALSKFKGRSFTYVNPNALSAGSYIADATNEIYFAPDGVMGAAAVVGGSGEDVADTMKLKLNSYLLARVHVIAGPSRYRADVQRAMMDSAFEFKIGDQVIKPPGELLSLTAKDACKTYGSPPEPLLGAGIAPDLPGLLTQVYGRDGYIIQDFQLTWSEELAKWLNTISPVLLGAGILLLFLEFKASSFGVLGFIGVCLLVLVFAGSYVAGLAGYEPFLLFLLGLVLITLEVFVFTGSLACGALGFVCFIASFIWAMTDVWPSEHNFGISPEALARPVFNVVLGLVLAIAGCAVALRFLPHTRAYSALVNTTSVPNSNPADAVGASTLPAAGARGVAVTDLRPLGVVEIAGARFQARAAIGQIDRGSAIEVVSCQDFALKVQSLS
jgi:membrane-bound serine protease (ClpP class)